MLSAEQMRRLNPTLPKAAKILFLNDPFDMDEAWQMQGLLQLCYNDHNLDVQTLKRMNPQPAAAEIATFEYIFDHTNAGIIQVKP